MVTQRVEILLATYKPNPSFLAIQLESLNRQSYPNLFLRVRDDSADDITYAAIETALTSTITAFPFELSRNSENIGSNSTFELLTRDANGDWIAYCDQDDDWLPEKISNLVRLANQQKAVLAYSDLSIIDAQNHQTFRSFRAMNPRLKHVQGAGLFDFFLRRNSVTGCTMLLRTDIAQRALPFEKEHYVHDHWLALFSSSIGYIAYSSKPLIRYRIHNDNQIGNSILRGISDKSDYLTIRLQKEKDTYLSLLEEKRFVGFEVKVIESKLQWVIDRENFFRSPNPLSFTRVLKSLPQDPQLVLLEIFIVLAPKKIGMILLEKLQR
jgi:glycosyltransferase involved in cell wall biosynthesis